MRKIIFNESILDPVQRTRCRDIFDENDRIRPEVKSFIEDTFYKWYNELDYKPFKVAGFKLIGSSTGYQYTDISDIDVQVYCDMDPAIGDPVPYFKKMFRQLPNGNLLPGTSHPINYFQVDSENPPADIKVENRYDMATNVWEKKSDAREIGIPIQYVRDVAQFFTDGIDLALSRYERSKVYLEDIMKLSPETHAISERELDEALNNAILDLSATIDSMRIAAQLLYGFLLDAYNENNFFHVTINYKTDDDPRYSMNNLIYKSLDRFEYRQRLYDKIAEGREVIKEAKKLLNDKGDKS